MNNHKINYPKFQNFYFPPEIFTIFLTTFSFFDYKFLFFSYFLLQNILEFYFFYLNVKYYGKYENVNKNSFCNFYCEWD